MRTAFLNPADTVDLTSEFWTVKQLPALTTVALGVRVNEDHLARVRRARMAIEQGGAVTDSTPIKLVRAGNGR